ncbi:hypothetical protein H8B13_13755 [Hymenobacter sp. BT188]|uniref:DUF5723 family protein n=1 Tax=Hymenobacter sp. BT188 TaxID=2763504 RepID=UPI0016511FD8|nr:DUF5723 family protein [Hymenobacter sp. BT188]MBC6607887.1 hypothetical protein [Hymenobacter sp. BT188]
MRKSLLFYVCGSLLVALPNYDATAQQMFNPSHSNFAGIGGAIWNPATIADNRYSVQLELLAIDGHATNTAYRYTGPWSLNSPSEDFELESRYLQQRTGDRPNLVSAGVNARGPGLLLRLNSRHSIAGSTRVRAALQGNNVSQELIRNAVDEFENGGRFTDNKLNLNMNAFAEWNLTYGRVVFDEGPHFLKTGITVKRLMGAGSAYLQAKSMNLEVAAPGGVSDTTVRIRNLDGAFGYSNPRAFDDLDTEEGGRWLRGQNTPGSGWGADIGFVYEYRPDGDRYRYRDAKGAEKVDHGRNKYRYRLAVAITDIGGIRYRDQAVAYNEIKTANLGVSNDDVNGIDLDNFDERIERILRAQDLSKDTKFVAGLPTALNVDFDYHVGGKIYANAAVSQSLRGRYAIGMRQLSYAAFTPRLETRWLEIAAPVSLVNNYQMMAYGLMLRVGPLTIGSNNLQALFEKSNPYGANAYAEVSLFTWANKRYKAPKKAKTPTQKIKTTQKTS